MVGQGHGWLGLLSSASPRAQMGEVLGGWRRGLWPGKHRDGHKGEVNVFWMETAIPVALQWSNWHGSWCHPDFEWLRGGEKKAASGTADDPVCPRTGLSNDTQSDPDSLRGSPVLRQCGCLSWSRLPKTAGGRTSNNPIPVTPSFLRLLRAGWLRSRVQTQSG